MKKTILLALTLLLSLTFVQCNNDDDIATVPEAQSTLFVDGKPFRIGTNAGPIEYNSLLKGGNAATFYSDAFSITSSDASVAATESLLITLIYENNGPTDGTFDFVAEGETPMTENFALGSYTSLGENIPHMSNGDGTVKVTDNGNGRYKLEFTNFKVTTGSGTQTKSITGYCEAQFAVRQL